MKKKNIHIIAFTLFGLFILANILFFYSGKCFACEQNLIEVNKQIIETINLNEWKSKISDDIVILDIRTKEEFNFNKIEDAINIDFYSNYFKDEISKLDKNKVYLIYCRSGSRGKQALKVFEKLEFKEVYNLKGGINVYNWLNINFILNLIL